MSDYQDDLMDKEPESTLIRVSKDDAGRPKINFPDTFDPFISLHVGDYIEVLKYDDDHWMLRKNQIPNSIKRVLDKKKYLDYEPDAQESKA